MCETKDKMQDWQEEILKKELIDNSPFNRENTKPNKDQERKSTPVFSGLFAYFPLALQEVAKVSIKGNIQHLNGEELKWDRTKSNDHLNSASRHLLDHARGEIFDEDNARHLSKVVWRLLAQLQIDLEKESSTAF